jgi:chromosome segregation ATPase
MATTIETDLKEVLGDIQKELREIRGDLSDLKLNQFRMEEKLSGQINALDGKLSGQINALDGKLSGQINALDEKLSGQINVTDEKLSGQINVLDEKVTGFGKRLENQEFTNRGILIALILSLIAGAAKLFGLIPPT